MIAVLGNNSFLKKFCLVRIFFCGLLVLITCCMKKHWGRQIWKNSGCRRWWCFCTILNFKEVEFLRRCFILSSLIQEYLHRSRFLPILLFRKADTVRSHEKSGNDENENETSLFLRLPEMMNDWERFPMAAVFEESWFLPETFGRH